MKVFALSCVLGSGIASSEQLPGERDLSAYTFEKYSQEFGKVYNGIGESESRKAIFTSNLALINKQNSDDSKTWFATINEFTDWTNEEFRAKRAHGTRSNRGSLPTLGAQEPPAMSADIPASLDWRTKSGVVTPVKDQGSCGSCWAFSATETMESAFAIATGEAAPVLSPQQIVSCSPNPKHCGGTGGCDGSTQELGFSYTETAGLTLDSDYQYTASTGTCQTSKISPVAKNAGFVQLPKNNYTSLINAVANQGPIAISVAAGAIGWQFYGGGVFSGNCGWDEDHAVQLVGYGTEKDSDYWLVRNSWGESWGEAGYIKIKRFGEGKEPCGTDSTPQDGSACAGDTKAVTLCGLCGILSDSSYPTGVKKVGPTPPAPAPTPPSPAPTPPGPAPTPPGPAPTPPGPSPTPPGPPVEGHCEMQDTQADCLHTTSSGTVCQWCVLKAIHVGICENPTVTCDGARAAHVVV